MSVNYFRGDQVIDVCLTDEVGNTVLCKCDSSDIPSGEAGYAVGCDLFATDTGAHYYNTGSITSCTFEVVGTVTAGSIDTTELADGAVTLAKLDTAVAPSHIVVYADSVTTAGGNATEDITVSGVLSTDIAFAIVNTPGVSPVSVIAATTDTDTVSVTFDADPSNDTVVSYQVLRATS